MKEREMKTSGLKESTAGMSEFSEPEQRNDAAAAGVIHCSFPRGGANENAGAANMSIATASAPISVKTTLWATTMRRITNYVVNDFGARAVFGASAIVVPLVGLVALALGTRAAAARALAMGRSPGT